MCKDKFVPCWANREISVLIKAQLVSGASAIISAPIFILLTLKAIAIKDFLKKLNVNTPSIEICEFWENFAPLKASSIQASGKNSLSFSLWFYGEEFILQSLSLRMNSCLSFLCICEFSIPHLSFPHPFQI